MLLPDVGFLSAFGPDDIIGTSLCPPAATLQQALDANNDDVRDIADEILIQTGAE